MKPPLRRRLKPITMACLFCWGLSDSPSHIAVANQLQELESAIQSVFTTHESTIVRVKVATQEKDEDGEVTKNTLTVFTGFFISSDGTILTNATPNDESTRIWIEKDGVSYLADVIGSDERTNLSVLQAINLPKDFSYVPIDSNAKPPAIGSFAFAVTSPLDFSPSPSFGLVTGFESHFANFVFPFTYTRVSIPIGPAEGGSPVFDSRGRLLGISMASMPEVRSSYIIPPKALARIVSDMKAKKKVSYGVIPMEFEEKPDRYNLQKNIVVKEIVDGSPAFQAGVQKGDILVSIDGNPISNINQVRDIIFYKEAGSFLLFKVRRDERELEFAILLEPQEDHIQAS